MKLALILALVPSTIVFANTNPNGSLGTQQTDDRYAAVAALVTNDRGDTCVLDVAGHAELVPSQFATAPANAPLESDVRRCDDADITAITKRVASAPEHNQTAGPILAVLPMVCAVSVGLGVAGGILNIFNPGRESTSSAGFYAGIGAAAVMSSRPHWAVASGALGIVGATCALAGDLSVYTVRYVFKRSIQ